ncbi:MAG: hypothetical protein OXU20_25135 [Myxococcales bacterium]|nr:hypothetical protein [Myxococcales bacterium]
MEHIETTFEERSVHPLDEPVFERMEALAYQLPPATSPPMHRAPPAKLDLGQHLHFIRHQGGAGCFAYALLAVWDIMNEMACPYTPNLSLAPYMLLHRRRDIWESRGGAVTRDGRFVSFKVGPEYGFFQEVGNPTLGTEMVGYSANPWCGLTNLNLGPVALEGSVPTVGWTVEGLNEAPMYRLAGLPKVLPRVTSESLILHLAAGHPMRVQIPSHFLALVGYDLAAKTFTYVDSAGDRKHNAGFGTVTFAEVDDPKRPYFSKAEVIDIVSPRPVPAARIRFSHSNRMNVGLWLSVEGSPIPRRQIWPPPQYHDDGLESRFLGHWMPWDDNSRNLHFTVRLPTELIWPPGPNNRLVLDVHDSGAYTTTGGQLDEFTAAFGGHVVKCDALNEGPAQFGSHSHHRFFIE